MPQIWRSAWRAQAAVHHTRSESGSAARAGEHSRTSERRTWTRAHKVRRRRSQGGEGDASRVWSRAAGCAVTGWGGRWRAWLARLVQRLASRGLQVVALSWRMCRGADSCGGCWQALRFSITLSGGRVAWWAPSVVCSSRLARGLCWCLWATLCSQMRAREVGMAPVGKSVRSAA